jgi:Fe2+ transport system protein FeoA
MLTLFPQERRVIATDKSEETEAGIPVGRRGAGGADGAGRTGGSRAAFSLADLADGETGRVLSLSGGRTAVGKLEAMGMLAGALVEKKSAALNGGPVVVAQGGSQLAIPRSVAAGILVEPLGRRDGR